MKNWQPLANLLEELYSCESYWLRKKIDLKLNKHWKCFCYSTATEIRLGTRQLLRLLPRQPRDFLFVSGIKLPMQFSYWIYKRFIIFFSNKALSKFSKSTYKNHNLFVSLFFRSENIWRKHNPDKPNAFDFFFFCI